MNRRFFSAPLFTENLKRYWSMSALAFVMLFMSLPFYLLRTGDSGYSFYLVSEGLINHNFGFMVVNLILPIAAAAALYGYLFKVNSISTMHALPFSRTMLYATNYISGIVLVMIPYILTAVLLIALKQPTLSYTGEYDAYTVSAVLGWLLNSFSVLIFVFSVSVLGCIISGNGVIAVLTAAALNFLVPGIYLVCCGYMEKFCWGYTGNGTDDILIKLSPYLLVLDNNYSVIAQIIFIVIAIVIAVFGLYAYYNRKLERCGDSYVFRWIENVIGFIFVFVISSGCGLLLFEDMGITAYIIGGVSGFILGQMITRKTFRIFNKKSLKNLFIYSVLMVLIITCFAADLFGVEKMIPSEKDISSASIDGFFPAEDSSSYYSDFEAESEAQIRAVLQLHEDIIENKSLSNYELYGTYIDINYYLENGSRISRNYYVSYEFLNKNEAFNDIISYLKQ